MILNERSLRDTATRLKREGRMPSLTDFMRMMAEAGAEAASQTSAPEVKASPNTSSADTKTPTESETP
jgi:hypothetical protein